MAKLSVKEIQKLAKEIIGRTPGGIRYSTLHKQITSEHPETPANTVHGAMFELDKVFSGQIVKPSRGLFTLVSGSSRNESTSPSVKVAGPTARESDYYASFAEWLKNELEEATEAIDLGGSGLRESGEPRMLWGHSSRCLRIV